MLRLSIGFVISLVITTVGFGDGGFVRPRPRPVTKGDLRERVQETFLDEPEQHAIIHYQDGRETLYLNVRYEGNVSEFGWIVPVPSKPSVELAAPGLIEDLAKFKYKLLLEDFELGRIKPRVVGGGIITFGSGGGKERLKPAKKPEPVEVVEKSRLGLFDVTVLRAREEEALSTWLDEHGFEIPGTESAREILDHYIEADMYFCAFRVVAEPSEKETWLQPVSISFGTEQPYFPLRISRLHTRPKAVSSVYVHAFLPVDELSFTGVQRSGDHKFPETEKLFHAYDLPACARAFRDLHTAPTTLVTLHGGHLTAPDMRDLWIATTEAQVRARDAAKAWKLASAKDTAEAYRVFLSHHNGTEYARAARDRLAKIDDGKARETAEVAFRKAQSAALSNDFAVAVKEAHRALRIDPSLRPRVDEFEADLRSSQRDHVESRWSRLLETKKQDPTEKSEEAFLGSLIQFVRLCSGTSQHGSLAWPEDAQPRLEEARTEFAKLVTSSEHGLKDRFAATLEEVKYLARRNAPHAMRGAELILALAPQSYTGSKTARFVERMRRGLRDIEMKSEAE